MKNKRTHSVVIGTTPNAPVADPPAAVTLVAAPDRAAEIRNEVWEKGYKIGRGLEPRAARPYAEGHDGKVPHQLATVAVEDRKDFDAGFVAGFQSRSREWTGAQS